MDEKIKLLTVSLILVITTLTVMCLMSYTKPKPVEDNCWSHYNTENSAILHCEKH